MLPRPCPRAMPAATQPLAGGWRALGQLLTGWRGRRAWLCRSLTPPQTSCVLRSGIQSDRHGNSIGICMSPSESGSGQRLRAPPNSRSRVARGLSFPVPEMGVWAAIPQGPGEAHAPCALPSGADAERPSALSPRPAASDASVRHKRSLVGGARGRRNSARAVKQGRPLLGSAFGGPVGWAQLSPALPAPSLPLSPPPLPSVLSTPVGSQPPSCLVQTGSRHVAGSPQIKP